MNDQLILSIVIFGLLVFFISGKYRYDYVSLGALVLLILFDIIKIENAFIGFSHPAVITVALVLLISKGLKKTINWSGMGSIDKLFGFIFGAIKGYIYFITIFTVINLVHPYERWHDSLNKGFTFEIIIWGNELVVETFPKRYEYIDKSKEKLEKFR